MSENRFKKGDWTNCRYDICEIIDEDDEVVCIVSLNDADKVIAILEENERLKKELSECEKFRYSVFKRMEKTIEDKENCAINKDAKYPCKAYDECLKRKGTNKPLPCMVNWMMGRSFENMIRKE